MDPSKKFNISFFKNWLGGLVADHPRWWQWLGDRETRFYEQELARRRIDRPVYITGLARGGSTLILECLAEHKQTVTHRYRDYPFLHIPLWWNRFLDKAGAKESAPIQRFHEDRIFITSQSPEAMEEILWMAFFPDCHNPLLNNVFKADDTYPVFEKFYQDHIRKILFLREGGRYVAKANYHITRLEYLRRLFSDARFIVPVRSPVEHIASLWRQHRHFCTREQQDRRILNYMRRAGHFEFGLDRRPVNTGDTETVKRILALWGKGEEIRGLALAWRSIYQHLAELLASDRALQSDVLVVSYETLCRSPEIILSQIHDHCQLTVSEQTVRKQAGRISAPGYYDCPFSDREIALIEAETADVYQRILTFSKKGNNL